MSQTIICTCFNTAILMLCNLNLYLVQLVYHILIVNCDCDVTLTKQNIAQISSYDITVIPTVFSTIFYNI